MSGSGIVRLFLGEADFDFRLAIGELRQLEEGRSRVLAAQGHPPSEAGLEKIAGRLISSGWLVEEVREVLRLGLIGGGLDKERAARLVDQHVVPPDLVKCAATAYAVLAAALIGSPDDRLGGDAPAGERGGEAGIQAASPTADSAGAGSSARAPA